jgi:hypothetical protein
MSASPAMHARIATFDTAAGERNEPPPPARLAGLFSPELVKDAQALFANRMQRDVSETEARMMLANLTGYVRLLSAAG